MIYLSLGSNLESSFGNRYDNLNTTIELIEKEKIQILKASSFYETPSYPNKDFPPFINIVVEIEYNYTPQKLLKTLSIIEKKMGRKKKFKNDPRICDIDIIDFNGLILKDKLLTLPHSRVNERNFVLYPLIEICPFWINPSGNKKISILIDNLTTKQRNEITRMKESVIFNK
jgi:2-amino-4-hydroxy-6-hydroxymethyldihydropteridine diphosphokinase